MPGMCYASSTERFRGDCSTFWSSALSRAVNPRQLGKPLRGDKGEFWSYRVGDYRIISLIEDRRLVVVFVSVGHRGHVYR